MKNFIILYFTLFLFLSFHPASVQESRKLQNESEGDAPSFEEEFESNAPFYSGYGGPPLPPPQTQTTVSEEETGESGAEVQFVPTSLLNGFVVDIHFLAGDPRFQYVAYHFCTVLYPGYTQCDLYNSTKSNSRIIGTEIIVTADIFEQLPMQERKFWHSHAFAVKSGILVSPNTPADQDLQVMSAVMNTYGKVTDIWHSYQNFPYGGAKLAYGLAEESQINETVANQLDKELGLNTTWKERAKARASLNPTILEGADAYLTTGEFPQFITQMFPVIIEGNSTQESNEEGFIAVNTEGSSEDCS